MLTIDKINLKIIFLALFLLNGLAYHNAVHNDFRYDQRAVYAGAQIPNFIDRVKYAFHQQGRDIKSSQPALIWFRPVPFLISWELIRASHGNPSSINIINVVIITVVGFILFRWISFLFPKRKLLALISAVIFCLHPVNGVWINDYQGGVHILLFLGVMLLCTHAFFVHIAEEKGWIFYAASLFLFFISLLFHEIAVFLPLYMVLTIHFWLPRNQWRAYKLLVPFVFLIGIYLAWRHTALGTDSFVKEGVGFVGINYLSYGATLIKVFALYLGKLITLDGIVISWSAPFLKDGFGVWYLLGGILAVVTIGLLIMRRPNILDWAFVLTVAGFFPICVGGMLLPAQGLIYESNWFFFTSIGFFVLAGWLVEFFMVRFRRAGYVIFLVLVIVLLNASWAYNSLYADEIRYARYYRQHAPGFRMVHFFLFKAYHRAGRFEDARQVLLDARKGDESDFDLYYSIAAADWDRGDYADAEESIRLSLALNPGVGRSYLILGQIYDKQGKREQAQEAYKKAVELNPLLK